jgi:hypothetical protein
MKLVSVFNIRDSSGLHLVSDDVLSSLKLGRDGEGVNVVGRVEKIGGSPFACGVLSGFVYLEPHSTAGEKSRHVEIR